MHEDFPKLFAEISVDGAGRDQRWQGVAAFTKQFTKQKVEVLVRLAFDTKPQAARSQQEQLEPTLASFRKGFVDADPSYTPERRQEQVLAAAALLQLMVSSSPAAMAVTTTAAGGARKAHLPLDLIAAAENAISRLGAIRRVRPDLDKAKVKAPKFIFDADLTQVQLNQPQTFKPTFDQLVAQVNTMISTLMSGVNSSFEKFVDAGRMADEELDILNWAFGGRSLLTDKAFAAVPALERPLLLARDLASLTKIVPGPIGIRALLSRAGVEAAGHVKIVDAVNAVSQDWTRIVLKDRTASPASSPIHFALARREETGGDGGWETGYAAVTGIDAAATLSPIRLAELFYREILWLR